MTQDRQDLRKGSPAPTQRVVQNEPEPTVSTVKTNTHLTASTLANNTANNQKATQKEQSNCCPGPVEADSVI